MSWRAIAFLIVLATVHHGVASAQDTGDIVQVYLHQGNSVVGEYIETDGETIRMLVLRSRQVTEFAASSVSSHRILRTDEEILSNAGFYPFLVLKAERALIGIEDGRVAQISASHVYVATDDSRGVRRGDRLAVSRLGKEIVDPKTQATIGRISSRVCLLEVIEVEPRLITTRVVPESGADPEIGDAVVDTLLDRPAAVLPLWGADALALSAAAEIQPELTELLIDSGFRVVERIALDQAVEELALQHSSAFDPKTAQRIGGLVGAYAVFVGEVTPRQQRTEIRLRLVHVATGEILLTCSGSVANSELATMRDSILVHRTSLRDRVVGSRWLWSGDPNGGIFTYHMDGTVTCTTWYGPGTWRVLNSNTILQQDHKESNRWRIVFSDDMQVATWHNLRHNQVVVCPAVN
jgi:hypothetical protein